MTLPDNAAPCIDVRISALLTLAGRRGGKSAAVLRAVLAGRARGVHVHISGRDGTFCAALEQPADCTLPRWDPR